MVLRYYLVLQNPIEVNENTTYIHLWKFSHFHSVAPPSLVSAIECRFSLISAPSVSISALSCYSFKLKYLLFSIYVLHHIQMHRFKEKQAPGRIECALSNKRSPFSYQKQSDSAPGGIYRSSNLSTDWYSPPDQLAIWKLAKKCFKKHYGI